MSDKVRLNKSLSFWSDVLITLDKKLKTVEESYGFGEISVTFKIHRGRVNRVIWVDTISDMSMVKKAGGVNEQIKLDKKT